MLKKYSPSGTTTEGSDAQCELPLLSCACAESALCPQENGPTAEEVAKVTKAEQRKWEDALQENLFWHELVVNMLQHRVYFRVISPLPGEGLDFL